MLCSCAEVDYEKQKSYSLTLEAKDGGGRITTVNILVQLADVNDNAPVFELTEYRRTVREGAVTFQPQFFVRVSASSDRSITVIEDVNFSASGRNFYDCVTNLLFYLSLLFKFNSKQNIKTIKEKLEKC